MSFFVCDLCNVIDSVELAYPLFDFTNGPPAPWRCTTCQHQTWHDQFTRSPYFDKSHVYVVNRPHCGDVPGFG